jgi:CsoR family transcriptional regulator, copper-sensing transcriptional repressor
MRCPKAKPGCHADPSHPDHRAQLPRLNRAIGQLEGIGRMVDERRYCVDILVQFRAAMSALRNIEAAVYETHLQHCVSAAMLSRDPKQVEAKIRELTELLSRRTQL